MKQPAIVTDYTRLQLNVKTARAVAALMAAGAVLHNVQLVEVAVACLPLCFQLNAPRWVKTLAAAFFVPFVFMGLIGVFLAQPHESAFSALIMSLYYFGFPVGFISVAVVAAWLGICKVSTGACNCLFGSVHALEVLSGQARAANRPLFPADRGFPRQVPVPLAGRTPTTTISGLHKSRHGKQKDA
ncbi:MAG TPA: hypothetical protein V6D08_18550 [Candidatus Obscuribacterales bacterium]